MNLPPFLRWCGRKAKPTTERIKQIMKALDDLMASAAAAEAEITKLKGIAVTLRQQVTDLSANAVDPAAVAKIAADLSASVSDAEATLNPPAA
jgi:predicted  nucleic acid-binding Zn-ribbon protein